MIICAYYWDSTSKTICSNIRRKNIYTQLAAWMGKIGGPARNLF